MIDVEAIRKLCEAATPGPWEAAPFARYPDESTYTRWRLFLRGHVNPHTNSRDCDWTKPDAEFIAQARTLVPQLLEAYERMLPVVQAAEAWAKEGDGADDEVPLLNSLFDAIDQMRRALDGGKP